MININHLRVFYHVATNLSFTIAARDLFISQPAVTTQVKHLEQVCGFKLFLKKGNHIFLTEEGKTVFEGAKQLFQCEIELENMIRNLKESKREILRIGIPRLLLTHWKPFFLDWFKQEYPNIIMHLRSGSSLEVLQSLMTFENEITIGSEFGSFPDIQMDPLYRFKILPIMGPGHPFSSRQTVSFDEFSKKPLVLQEAGSGTRDKVIKLFEQYKCTPNLFLETSSYEMIKAVIQEGQCIGFLIEPAVSQEIKIGNILVVPLDAPDIYTTICIAYRKNSQLSLAAKTFLKEWKKTGQIMEYGEQP